MKALCTMFLFWLSFTRAFDGEVHQDYERHSAVCAVECSSYQQAARELEVHVRNLEAYNDELKDTIKGAREEEQMCTRQLHESGLESEGWRQRVIDMELKLKDVQQVIESEIEKRVVNVHEEHAVMVAMLKSRNQKLQDKSDVLAKKVKILESQLSHTKEKLYYARNELFDSNNRLRKLESQQIAAYIKPHYKQFLSYLGHVQKWIIRHWDLAEPYFDLIMKVFRDAYEPFARKIYSWLLNACYYLNENTKGIRRSVLHTAQLCLDAIWESIHPLRSLLRKYKETLDNNTTIQVIVWRLQQVQNGLGYTIYVFANLVHTYLVLEGGPETLIKSSAFIANYSTYILGTIEAAVVLHWVMFLFRSISSSRKNRT